MATLTVREIDDDLKARLRARAGANGHSVDAEVREILRLVLEEPRPHRGIGTRIYERFAPFGGVEIALPNRSRDDSDHRIPDIAEQLAVPHFAGETTGDVDIDLTDPELLTDPDLGDEGVLADRERDVAASGGSR